MLRSWPASYVLGLTLAALLGPSAWGQPLPTLDLGDGITLSLATLPAGSFVMGSPPSELGRGDDEGPARTVSFARPFRMGTTEVTQRQWQAVMGSNPSAFQGAERPVENVSWKDASEFCRRLSAKTGATVRLPSEAEWEYACRADTKTPWSHGDDESALGAVAWYQATAGDTTHDVGTKKANPRGLFDMHGNVSEWCADDYHDNYVGAPVDGSAWEGGDGNRVHRGGARFNDPFYCRSSARGCTTPDLPRDDLGFRVVVDLPR